MRLGKDLVSLKDISKIYLVYPNVNTKYKWFIGQDEIIEKRWYRDKVIQEAITEGWYDNYYDVLPESQSDIKSEKYLNRYNMYIDLEFEGAVMNEGYLTIQYKNGGSYNVYSRDKSVLDSYFDAIDSKVGTNMLVVFKNK